MGFKRFAAGAALLVAAMPGTGQADVSASAELYEQMNFWGGHYDSNLHIDINLTFEQRAGAGADVTGTTPTTSTAPSGVRVRGYIYFCDLTDYNPCAWEGIDAAAPGAGFGALGNSFSMQGYIPAGSLGVLPVEFSASKPSWSYLNPTNGQVPNAWVDGSSVHADVPTWSSFTRQGYATSVKIFSQPLSWTSAYYSAQLATSTALDS